MSHRSTAIPAALLCLLFALPAISGEDKRKAKSPWRVEVKGERKPGKVIRAIRRRNRLFLRCIKRTMTKRHLGALGGKLAARFVIDKAGAVRAVKKVKSTFKYPEVDRCMLGRIKQLRFQPSSGENQVHYTWHLERII